ncbi:MAG: nucleotidyltransferase family protein [Pseudomonadota bacterium]
MTTNSPRQTKQARHAKQAVVLAAGLGTRMRPLTLTRPKPLVEVAGITLLDHALDTLAAHGISHCAVNVHYLADQIETHLSKRGDMAFHISDERQALLDSGGGVAKAHGLLPEQNAPFFLLNADSFWRDRVTPSLATMDRAFDNTVDMLMLVARHGDAVGFDGKGDFFMDDSHRLTRRGNADHAPYVYAGALLIRPELFRNRPKVFSLNTLFDEAITKGRLAGVVLDGLWLHVGTPQAIGEAEIALAAFEQKRSA